MALSYEQLLQGLLQKVFSVITNGSQQFSSSNVAVAWALPGIPFTYEDLDFNVVGLNDTKQGGDKVRERISNAENFSRLVNAVPEAEFALDANGSQFVYNLSGRSVVDLFDIFLRFSEVAHQELTEDQKQRIDRFRRLLSEEIETEDILTGKKVKRTVDGRLKKAYQNYESAYTDALIAYNNLRLDALNSADSRAVQAFALNGSAYQKKLQSAYNEWVSSGYKNEYEEIVATIDSITRRNLESYKADLLSKFENAKILNPTTGASFHFTSMFPASFLAGDGWARFSYNKEEVSLFQSSVRQGVSANVKVIWGLFSGSASTGYKSENHSLDTEGEKFKIEFSLAQAPISRPWFSNEFLRSSGWRFANNSPIKTYSDGGIPIPKGEFPIYTRTAIFIRDITIESDSFARHLKEHKSSLQVETAIGFGPFSFGGSYSRDEENKKLQIKIEGSTVTVKGIQLIGFLCEKNPKVPNTDTNITDFT